MLISLGSNCCVRLQINNKINSNRQTHLFDYIITGKIFNEKQKDKTELKMDHKLTENYSVLNIIEILKINSFNINDFYYNKVLENEKKTNKIFIAEHCPILHKYFISLHDLNWDKKNLKDVIDKFNRRLFRFRKLLIETKEHINFIRIEYSQFDINNYYKLVCFLLNNYPNLKFTINIIITPNNICINNHNNFIKIYYKKDYLSGKKWDLKFENIDWNNIFNKIKNNK